jgi:hypothetical protein
LRLAQTTSRKFRTAATVATLTLATALSGCGGGKSEPASTESAASALASTFDTDQLSTTITLDVSDNVIRSMFDKPDQQSLAKELFKSQISIQTATTDGSKLNLATTDVAQATRANSAIAVNLSGDNLLDLRLVEGSLYAAVGVDKIAQLAGEDPAQLDPLAQAYGPGVGALLDGKFVSLSKPVVDNLLKQAQTGDQDAQEAVEIYSILADAVPATLAKSSSSSDIGDDKTRVKVDVRKFVDEYFNALNTPETIARVAKVTGESEAELAKELDTFKADLPDDVKDLTFDVTIKDGKATELSLDLIQFASWSDRTKAKFGGGHAHLKIAFDNKADIKAPQSPTNLDQQLSSLLSGGY